MPCEIIGCLSGVSSTEMAQICESVRMLFGAPIVKVELADIQIENAMCSSVKEYSSYINDWFLRNKLGEMLGLPKEIDFTLKYVANTQYFEQSFQNHIAEQMGLGANSMREMKTGSIVLSGGTQDYLIPAGREVNEVLWYTPSFINLFGLDPHATNNIAFSEFGASFAGHTLYHVMPVFDTLLSATAAEMRNRVRGAEYHYSTHGGPDGQRRLRPYPIPNSSNGSTGTTLGGAAMNTPGTVFYRYYDRVGFYGNPAFSGTSANPGYTASTTGETVYGNGLVATPADASLQYISYAQMNSVAKNWVVSYAAARCALTLSFIRGKFSEVPIPDDKTTLNAPDLRSWYNEEKERLFKKLADDLEQLSYQKIMENRAAVEKSISEKKGFDPMGIYVY